jgi:predicted MPP superfamily phosphohydrolase
MRGVPVRLSDGQVAVVGKTGHILIAQLSDIHVGSGRYRPELLRAAIEEVNAAQADVVVVAGDLTDDGYADEYSVASAELAALTCPRVVMVPGNHDARNVGYLRSEKTLGSRDSRLRAQIAGMDVALVAVDSSKLDLEHYGWIEEGFAEQTDLRVFRLPSPFDARSVDRSRKQRRLGDSSRVRR